MLSDLLALCPHCIEAGKCPYDGPMAIRTTNTAPVSSKRLRIITIDE